MEGTKKQVFTIQVEDGKPGKDGRPAVGPVFRNILAKDGFPPLDPDMRTSWDVFRTAAGKYPDNRMLGWRPFKDGVPGPYLWKSYKDVYEEVLQIGSALQQLGVQPGSRVGIYGSNCPQWVVAMQACNGYSIICVPLYDTLGAGAVDYIIDHAEIDVVFIQDKKIKEILSPNCTSATRLKALVAFTSANNEQIKDAEQIGMKVYSWNDFLKMGKDKPVQPRPPQPNDTCTIMYTSGTSGQPKGVMLSHESHGMYVKGVDLFMDQFEDKMSMEDVFLSFLPLAHILDRMIEEYFFHKGASVGYYHGDLNALRDDLMELKPTLLVGVPRVYEKIYEGILKALADLRPLRRVIFNALYNRKLAGMKDALGSADKSPPASQIPRLISSSTLTTTQTPASASAVTRDVHPVTPSSSTPEEVHPAVQVCWELLHQPLCVRDEDGLQSYLLQEGIFSVQDLVFCDATMLQTLSTYLKTVPQRRFQQAITAWPS